MPACTPRWLESGSTWIAIRKRASPSCAAKAADLAGGDLAMVEEMTRDFAVRARVWREAKDLVYNLINCPR